MRHNFRKQKGFTLIELIVVLAIIGVLVVLGLPKYKEYVKDAQLTRIKVNVKELEQASQKYYMSYNDWPRLTDEPYTAEQIEDFGEKVLARTGEVALLDSEGNYYDIDYSKIEKYVKIPEDNIHYILQNPVGSVFYIQGITEAAEIRVTNPDLLEKEIVFNGSSPLMFDKDDLTGSNKGGLITWEGDISGRKLNILSKAGYYPGYSTVLNTLNFFDKDGNKLSFFTNLETYVNSYSFGGVDGKTNTVSVIVPDGAVSMNIVLGTKMNDIGIIYEISLNESSKRPNSVTGLAATATEHSVTLTWNDSDSTQKKRITREGKYIGSTNTNTFTEYPVYYDREYTYEVSVINEYGNSSKKATKTIRTLTPEVIFSGLTEEVYDKNELTGTELGGLVTWNGDITGRKISILSTAGYYPGFGDTLNTLTFLDSEGNKLYFLTNTGSNVNSYNFGGSSWKANTVSVVVPDGAVSMNIVIGVKSGRKGTIYEINLEGN